jgi:hypothetical protein
MADNYRMNIILATFRKLLDATSAQGTEDARKELDNLNVTAEEFVKIANREDKLPGDFDVDKMLVIPEDDEDENEAWEENYRHQKEADDLEQFAAPVDAEGDHDCYTCGSACVPYQVEGQTYWMCEDCYYGKNDNYVYEGETGLDYNESGYYD